MLRHVDLCSGIGGFALGFEWAGLSQPILFCDTEPWCRQILKQHWPDVPIAEDVKDLANEPNTVPDCDIITAGYPCQPFSVAGKQEGTEDDRHIWPYISEIVSLKRPTWVVLENVYGHIALGLDQVLFDLEAEGYTSRTFIVPACGVDAPHRRDRIFVVGYTEHNGLPSTEVARGTEEASGRGTQGQGIAIEPEGTGRPRDSGSVEEATRANLLGDTDSGQRSGVEPTTQQGRGKQRPEAGREDVADTTSQRPQGWVSGRQDTEWKGEHGQSGRSSPTHRQPEQDWWATEPMVGRVAHGIPKRVDRLKGLGNAIVPQIAQQIGLSIKAVEDKKTGK